MLLLNSNTHSYEFTFRNTIPHDPNRHRTELADTAALSLTAIRKAPGSNSARASVILLGDTYICQTIIGAAS